MRSLSGKSYHRAKIAIADRGFTLIELAVGIFIITLLLGSLLVPLTTQVTQRKISDTQKNLEETKEALIGFAITNGRLPCPAQSSTNGVEKAACITAVDRAGYIPWTTLGVSQLDAWGNVIRYSVTPAYASATLFTLATARDITIQNRNSLGAIANLTNANDIPAVVMSYGKNGYGAVSSLGVAVALPAGWAATNIDENTNANGVGGNVFVSRNSQDAGATGTGGEFDDIVVWISPNILFNRMVAAGQLPR